MVMRPDLHSRSRPDPDRVRTTFSLAMNVKPRKEAITPMDRRKFFRLAATTGLGSVAAAGVYPFLEAKWCRVTQQLIALPNLPATLRGTTIALISDIHHGPFVPLAYIRHVVELANSLKPDLVLLTGDFVSRSRRYIEPGADVLRNLRAKLGRFAVLGNHDHWESASESREALSEVGIIQTDNTGYWLEQHGARLRVCGVGDLWTDYQDPRSALGDATENDAVVMLSHNPDFAEDLQDRRVGLLVSGHTHGGQVVIPAFGAPIVPSKYGQKYLYGLVQGPRCQVFVTALPQAAILEVDSSCVSPSGLHWSSCQKS
jgi:predicted MPP superfamily phosphohydrolase